METPETRDATGRPENAAVLAFLAGRSAHTDAAEDLLAAVRGLDGVAVLCPDPAKYSYVAVAVGGVVFGFATGMGSVGFRVAPHAEEAAAAGADLVPGLGSDWAVFGRGPGRTRPDLSLWARRAYDVAAALSRDGVTDPAAGE